jgi:uncharacterized protein YjbI with pentapeptide repeats
MQLPILNEGIVSAEELSAQVKKNIQQVMTTGRCNNCNLAGANFNRAELSQVDLSGADLHNATFFLANLTNANFRNANLQGAEFGGADIAHADFRGAGIAEANFTGTYKKGTFFDDKDVEKNKKVAIGGATKKDNKKDNTMQHHSTQKMAGEDKPGARSGDNVIHDALPKNAGAPPVKRIKPLARVTVIQP